MRLRLFERLRRIVSWRSPDRSGHARARDSYPREDSGRHRRSPAVPPPRPTAQPRSADTGLPQPPAGLPRRPAAAASGPPRPPAGRSGDQSPVAASLPRLTPRDAAVPRPARLRGYPAAAAPRNSAPPTGAAARGRAGVGRARIREAPFGAAPVESVAARAGELTEAQAPGMPSAAVVPGARASQVADQQAQFVGHGGRGGLDQAAAAPPAGNASRRPPACARRPPAAAAALPFAAPHPEGHPPTADGRRNCGALEKIL